MAWKRDLLFAGKSFHECISTLQRPQKWCSLTENFDKHEHWGYCLSEFVGSWSSWSGEDSADSQCSVSCGSGHLSRKRICRFQPCAGLILKLDGFCNTQPCTVCFKEVCLELKCYPINCFFFHDRVVTKHQYVDPYQISITYSYKDGYHLSYLTLGNRFRIP